MIIAKLPFLPWRIQPNIKLLTSDTKNKHTKTLALKPEIPFDYTMIFKHEIVVITDSADNSCLT